MVGWFSEESSDRTKRRKNEYLPNTADTEFNARAAYMKYRLERNTETSEILKNVAVKPDTAKFYIQAYQQRQKLTQC